MPSNTEVREAELRSGSAVTAPERAHGYATPREQVKQDVITAECWFSELEYVSNGRTQLALDRAPTPPRLAATCPAYRAKAREAAHAQRIKAFIDSRASIPWREVLGCDLKPTPPAESSDSEGDAPRDGPTPASFHTPGAYMRRRWGVVGAESRQTAGGAAACAQRNRGQSGAAAASPLLWRDARDPGDSEVSARRGGAGHSASFCAGGSRGHSQTPAAGWTTVRHASNAGAAGRPGPAGPVPLAWVPAVRPDWELVDAARPPRASAQRGEFCATLARLETFCLACAAVAPPRKPREEQPRWWPKARRRGWSPPGRVPPRPSHSC